jgi:hypothetical protein
LTLPLKSNSVVILIMATIIAFVFKGGANVIYGQNNGIPVAPWKAELV